jgi:hypothetical protein
MLPLKETLAVMGLARAFFWRRKLNKLGRSGALNDAAGPWSNSVWWFLVGALSPLAVRSGWLGVRGGLFGTEVLSFLGSHDMGVLHAACYWNKYNWRSINAETYSNYILYLALFLFWLQESQQVGRPCLLMEVGTPTTVQFTPLQTEINCISSSTRYRHHRTSIPWKISGAC